MTFTPKLGLMQPVFGNSYLYLEHIKKHVRGTTSTPNLGLMQPVFGNSYFYAKQ
jgi:hypothetical protein